jgi:preprotein translocase subunit SecY
MAGVIPIIFAVTLIYLPSQLEMAFQGPAPQVAEIFRTIGTFLMPDFTKWQGLVGLLLYSALIFMFTYFWTAIQYNVDDLTDNLRKSGSYITGIRPGRQTKEFLDKVISRVTTIGAMFLAVAAMTQYIFPLVVRNQQVAMLAGTSLLIMVSVALEVMRQIEAHLITKQYEGG